jgi:hypothetical protein
MADIALSPAALDRLAEAAPAGHWVFEPFDDASGLPARPFVGETAPAAVADPSAPAGWFM